MRVHVDVANDLEGLLACLVHLEHLLPALLLLRVLLHEGVSIGAVQVRHQLARNVLLGLVHHHKHAHLGHLDTTIGENKIGGGGKNKGARTTRVRCDLQEFTRVVE